MEILLERINLLRLQPDGTCLSFKTIEIATGLSKNSIHNWGESTPSGDKIKKVANYFDVSVDYLVGNTDNPHSHKNPDTLISTIAHEITDAFEDLSDAIFTAEKAKQKMHDVLTQRRFY